MIPIKLLKYESVDAQNTPFCQENNKLVSCLLAFPLPSLGIELNPSQKSRLSLIISASVVLLAFAWSSNCPPAYTHTSITHYFVLNEWTASASNMTLQWSTCKSLIQNDPGFFILSNLGNGFVFVINILGLFLIESLSNGELKHSLNCFGLNFLLLLMF